MKLTNPWVGYANRSYLSIKNSLLNRLGEKMPEVSDHSESNILVIILSMFAGVAEMLNYYIDNTAREAFLPTARRYSSVVRHTRLIDYRIKAIIPATVDLQIKFVQQGIITPTTNPFNIPIGTIFTTANGIQFVSSIEVNVPLGSTIITVPVMQMTYMPDMFIGTIETLDDPVFSLGSDYVNNSLSLTVGGEPWERVETLGLSGPTDKHYIVDISVDRIAYIRFGDNINGLVPTMGAELVGDYYVSEGANGNVLENNITTTEFNLAQGGTNFEITNLTQAVGGTDYEDIKRLKRSAPLHLRTLNRAVTEQDHVDISLLAPGVDKADIEYNCGKTIDIYISPNGGGVASSNLLQSTENYFEDKKMVGTFIKAKPAGISEIYLELRVTAKFRRSAIQTSEDVKNALLNAYSYENSDINKKIRLSDVIALVDNLEKVDYLDLLKIYLIPYIRPVGHNEILVGDIQILPGSNTRLNWKLQYDGSTMRLYKANIHIGNITINTPYTDPEGIISLLIEPGNYITGQEWEFTTEPTGVNIETNDFSVPVLTEDNLIITVIEQITAG